MRDATLPLVSFRLSFMGGLLSEPKGQEGVANLMTRVWAKATESMDSERFAIAVEDLGAYIDSQSGRNSLSLHGSFMSSNWLEGLELMVDALYHPAFAPDNIEEARQEVLSYIKLSDEHLTERMIKILRKALFQGHPYQGDPLGLAETVSSLSRDDLVAYYRSKVRPDNAVVAVAGDIEPKQALEVLERSFGSWKSADASPLPTLPEPPQPPAAPRETDESVDSAQTHLGVAFLAPGLGHPDQAPLEILSGHLNGLGGVLFHELRNKRGLAYSVGAGYNPGLSTGAFTFYIATDALKTTEALTEMMAIVEDVRLKPIDGDKVAGAIRYVTGNRKIHSQTLDSRSDEAVYAELYGLGPDFANRHLEALAAVTAEDIQRVAQKYLDPAKLTLSVIGADKSVQEAKSVIEPAKK
jgi:zinc protease